MDINSEIRDKLKEHGAEFISFIDISELPDKQSLGYKKAIIFGKSLSKKFIDDVNGGMKTGKGDEFEIKEHETDALADRLADYLKEKGYKAFSQSEDSCDEALRYNEETKINDLPTKTLAHMAGLGFIGKNALLVNDMYGCALSMCAVLTDAPVETKTFDMELSKCGNCNECKDACHLNLIFGREWIENTNRDDLIDIKDCDQCARCITACPYTLEYAKAVG